MSEAAERAHTELNAAVSAARRREDQITVKIGLAAAQTFSNLAIAAAIIETNRETK